MRKWKPAIGAVIAAFAVTFGVALAIEATPIPGPDPIRPGEPVAIFTPREPDEEPPPPPPTTPPPLPVGPACPNCF
jgi:hypothetical protein